MSDAHLPASCRVPWALALLAATLACAVPRDAAAACGNGTIEMGEECDPGGGTFLQGNPANASCTSGGNCFFRFSCCKFNCQFVGNGPTCDDGNACTGNGQCRQAEANCTGAVALAAGASCGSPTSDACTAPDTCNGSGTCLPNHATAGTACGDATDNQCNAPDTCDGAGTCQSNWTPAGTPAGTYCDDGGGCTADACDGSGGCTHTPVAEGEVCRGLAGTCDVVEVCTGGACPADAFAGAGTGCRAAAGVCDVAEACTGASPECPDDGLVATGTECRAAGGPCDVAEACTGSDAACPADAFEAASVTCRTAVGPCDAAEACTGTEAACPADALVAAGTECRAAADPCDVAEACTGAAASCPADAFAAAGIECRAAAGDCDLAESCTGLAAACPADVVAPAATPCRAAAGACDVAEECTGTTPVCPADGLVAAGTSCRAATGPCDAAEACTGSDAACPGDQKLTLECRPATGPCDPAETCDGAGDLCPPDLRSPGGTTCDDDNPCTGLGTCDGAAAACETGTPIVCDACEACDGVGGCVIGPLGVCRRVTGRKAKLIVKNRTPDDRDTLVWKFNKLLDGTETADFGLPLDPGGTDYHFCVFQDGATPELVAHTAIPAGPPWKVAGPGYRYKLQTRDPKGLLKVAVKASEGIGKLNFKAKGAAVPAIQLPLTAPVVVHFQSEATCWQARYSVPRLNSGEMFKGLADELP